MPLLAPKGLPADVKATLSDAMRKAMQSPEFVERLHKLNLVPGYLDSKDCRAFVEEESVRNAEVIKGLMAKGSPAPLLSTRKKQKVLSCALQC